MYVPEDLMYRILLCVAIYGVLVYVRGIWLNRHQPPIMHRVRGIELFETQAGTMPKIRGRIILLVDFIIFLIYTAGVWLNQ